MRYLATVLMILLLNASVFSQKAIIDSLRYQLKMSTKDTDKVNIMVQIADYFFKQDNLDSSFAYGNMAANLSRQIDWKLGEARGMLSTAGYIFFKQHNHVKCLSICLSTLSTFEKEKDSTYILYNLAGLATIYFLIEDFPLSIYYNTRQRKLAKRMGDVEKTLEATHGMADGYFFLKNRDSAVKYYQDGYNLALSSSLPDSNFIKGRSYLGLARASYISGDNEIAISYLKKAFSYAQFVRFDDTNLRSAIQNTYVDIFRDLKQWDSALVRIRLTEKMNTATESGMFNYNFYNTVANVFEHINKDSAIKYFKAAIEIRNVFNSRTRSEINNLTQIEAERQRDILKSEEIQEQSRKRNIQYTALAIGLGSLVILFLLYSRSIIGEEKLIRYLGLMLLLIVFEFLNLYMHSFLEHITRESPFFMLLTMVSIAALLIPAHHRVEHWVSHQLVEKNKRIRLAAAKKTIASLEGKR